MENEFFLNTVLQRQTVNFEPPPSTSSATIFNWPSSMEIQPPEQLNLRRNPTQDCFFWGKSTEQGIFDSALKSLVCSPSASNSNLPAAGGGDSFIIRELIGKLGNIGNRSGEIYRNPAPNVKCYATPMGSPPDIPMIEAKTTPLADFSGDPEFAERAARFSCFGSRSFNCRNTSAALAANKVNGAATNIRTNGKLPRVWSSPSLKALAPQICNQYANNNCNIINEESNVSIQQIPGRDSCQRNSGQFSRKRKSVPKGKSKENSPSTASPTRNSSKVSEAGNEVSDPKPKRSKVSEENGEKEEVSAKTTTTTKEEEEEEGRRANSTSKPPEPPKDYIHVRARRGQATDSHSLAERVRREKISERMKLLQDLVPGCDKVTGKALMLDEIINYVQSLQRQVEFLSMKLASVNTRLDFNMDSLLSKEIIQQSNNQPYLPPLDPLDTSNLTRSFNTQFTDPITLYSSTFCNEDLHTIIQMSFTQNSVHESEASQPQSQNFQSSNQASHMKIEI